MDEKFASIQRADGSVYYEGPPVTLAEAQMLINEAIRERRLDAGVSLRIEPDCLVIEDCGETA